MYQKRGGDVKAKLGGNSAAVTFFIARGDHFQRHVAGYSGRIFPLDWSQIDWLPARLAVRGCGVCGD